MSVVGKSVDEKLRIAIIGAGYVGATTGICLAAIGFSVSMYDTDLSRLRALGQSKLPIHEPGLQDLLVIENARKSIQYCEDVRDAVCDADFIFICVPTPQDVDGSADLSYVLAAARGMSIHLKPGAIVITKSTVPVGSSNRVIEALGRPDVDVASNPEFLREGSAVHDFYNPDRIVIGTTSSHVGRAISKLYESLDAERIFTNPASAELIKYASNTFLAMKISFINDIAALCENIDADIDEVSHGIGADSRIGANFLKAGPGWGGSCFPKDTRALASIGRAHGLDLPLIEAAIRSNDRTYQRIADSLMRLLNGSLEGKSIAVWGLAFKANTDDVRESPSLAIMDRLQGRGATITAYDPVALLPAGSKATQKAAAFDALAEADALVVLTEWREFAELDPGSFDPDTRRIPVLDARRILDVDKWKAAGFTVQRIGAR